MPAAPPPPGLFTIAIDTGTSFSSTITLWITRAIRSAPPPRPKGTTNSTSFVGFQPWADAASGTASKTSKRAKKRMDSLLSKKNYTRPHGDADRGRVERRSARHQIDRRGVRQAGKRVPGPGDRARARALPAVRGEKLPLGAPHADRACAEGAGAGGPGALRRPLHGA